MPNPQQEELRRSGNVPALNPDAVEAARAADRRIAENESRAPVPPDQRPGHHPGRDQDKPDLDAFAEALGVPADDASPATRDRPSTRTIVLAAVGVGLAGAVAWAVLRRTRRR